MIHKSIILVNSLASGGAEKVVTILVKEMNRQGISTQLLCLERDVFYKLPTEIKLNFLSSFSGKENSILKLLFLPYFAWKLKTYVKKNNVKLVQSHIYRANYVNVLAKIFGSPHTAQIVNCGQISRYLKKGLLGKINFFLISFFYAKADLLILKAHGMKSDMKKLFNFFTPQCIIYNPCDNKFVIKNASEKIIDFSFEKSKIYIVSVGRLISLKRNNDLIQAVSLCNNQNVEVLFLGGGEDRNALESYAINLNMINRIHFLGKVNNPYKYIQRCDVLVSCSESEGFPNVLIESLACGTPVIATDCTSGPREILAPNTDVSYVLKNEIELAEFGILVPVGRPEKIAEAIKKLLSDNTLYQQYRDAGEKRANDFDVKVIIEQYKHVMGLIKKNDTSSKLKTSCSKTTD